MLGPSKFRMHFIDAKCPRQMDTHSLHQTFIHYWPPQCKSFEMVEHAIDDRVCARMDINIHSDDADEVWMDVC
jgi:hypothetical protein